MFNLIKGFLYGTVLGLIFGVSIYLLASAVDAIAPLPATPAVLLAIIFGASVTAGVAKEYDAWLDESIGATAATVGTK
jgi:TctA family transporter